MAAVAPRNAAAGDSGSLAVKYSTYCTWFITWLIGCREYAGNLGDQEEEHDKKIEQEYLLNLVDKF